MNRALFSLASVLLILAPVRGDAAPRETSSDIEAEGTGPSTAASTALNAALTQIGKPYSFGAGGPDAYDASGLTYYAWKQAGKSIPRSVATQYNEIPVKVERDELLPGDLVFLYSPKSHVGMYVGDGKMIHAPSTGDVVKIVPVPWDVYSGAVRPG